MDIIWYGQACFKLKGKNASLVIDPFDSDYTGLKIPKDLEADIVFKTHDHKDHNNAEAVGGNPVIFSGPGEYEVKGVIISGISSFHDDVKGTERGLNTIVSATIDGLNLVHLGDLGQLELTEDQIAAMNVDILLIPVGSVYTIDAKAATNIISQLEPKIVIPMHYGIEDLKFPLDSVDKFLKEMGAENTEPIAKLSISKDKLPEELQVVLLSKT